MRKRIFRFLKHIIVTILFLGAVAVLFGLYHGASFHYGDDPLMMDWDGDGPYAFYTSDSTVSVNYISGDQEQGFSVITTNHSVGAELAASCYFPPDSSRFEFSINFDIRIPNVIYSDTAKILAISDIESGFRTFRDFLISNKVIDWQLNWIFGTGHLVLLGDFVDRGFSTTQVLWFIYKLEQDAAKMGGVVHFILGNHELKNMQGNFESSAHKYFHVASILEKKQWELLDSNSVLGRWMATKNSIERINGILFTHGGIHPGISNYELTLEQINEIVRKRYYKPYYPRAVSNAEQFLTSTHTGISWYRGYFKEDLKQEEVDRSINQFKAKKIVVGHTLQSRVLSKFNGKVIGIDVRHPKDYHSNFPNSNSEGLLIEGSRCFRVLATGEKITL